MAVRNEYKFVITTPYVKTAADNAEIKIGNAAKKKWGEDYTSFKSNIRRDLKHKQGNRCAFCRCRVSVGTSYSNLEHIVGKDDYPKFEFLPKNLVYACVKCNFSKSTKSTLVNPVSNTYPRSGGGFTIVHAHYDTFEAHLDFIDDIIITAVPGSTKGANTIKLYKLARPELAEERAYEWGLDQKSLNKQILGHLVSSAHDQILINQIVGILANMPDWEL